MVKRILGAIVIIGVVMVAFFNSYNSGKIVLSILPFLVISILFILILYQAQKHRKSEQLYATVIKTAQDAFWVCDMESRYLQVNDAFCEMLGYSRSELLTMSIADTKLDGTNEDVLNRFKRIKSSGTEQLEATHKCKSGKIIIMDARVTYMPDFGLFYGFLRDITDRKQKEMEIASLSYQDALTGIYNRAYFEKECRRLDSARQLPVSVLIGDVNGLKLANDVFGHAYGDQLLRSIAEIIRKCCRSEDMIARIGGDEFCILMPNAVSSVAQKICERIYTACGAAELSLGEVNCHPSVSMGFATKQQHEQLLSEVIRNAENSMYKRKVLESKSAHSSIIAAMSTTLFEKSNESREHADRLSSLARKVGEALQLPENQLSDLELLGELHDVGKIVIDGQILRKPGPLNEEEWAEIRKHPETGYRIANASGELGSVAWGILSHHERWDGKGYPQGLSGVKIPLSARIIAVVHSFDSLTHGKSYRKAISLEEAKREIADKAGKHFDPVVAEAFLNVVSQQDI